MTIDYELAIHLDAEELAEGGIKAAYERVCSHIALPAPAAVTEQVDPTAGAYSVTALGRSYVVVDPASDEPDAWAAATFALFDIVNQQLASGPHRLHALNGGNDLFGVVLTAEEVVAARAGLPARRDWPYLPTLEPPWFGMHHD